MTTSRNNDEISESIPNTDELDDTSASTTEVVDVNVLVEQMKPYMGGSFARLGLMGLGIGAVSVMKSYMQDSLGGGANLKHRGLNYAGDIAAFQTQMASTMRQRSLQAMHKSSINARSAFGQEAGMVHMNRDMFSQYRR